MNEEGNRFVAARQPTSAYHHEEAFASYWRILAWPTICAVLVLFFALRMLPAFPSWQEWALKGMVTVVLTLIVRYHYGNDRTPAIMVSALAGLVLGLASAVLHLVHDFAFYKLFSLLTYPSAAALVGAVLAWGTTWVAQKSATLGIAKLSFHREVK